jgi:cell wall-associated NlpC family hydrolase
MPPAFERMLPSATRLSLSIEQQLMTQQTKNQNPLFLLTLLNLLQTPAAEPVAEPEAETTPAGKSKSKSKAREKTKPKPTAAGWFKGQIKTGVKRYGDRVITERVHGLEANYRKTPAEVWSEIFLAIAALGIVTAYPVLKSSYVYLSYNLYRVANSPAAKFIGLSSDDAPSKNEGKAVSGSKVAATAMTWVGKDFKPGEAEQCAAFVRQVLKDAGIVVSPDITRQPLDSIMPSSPLTANSFGADQGSKIEKKRDLRPGDLVFFANTYGEWPPGTITHVAIYLGDGEVIDRPTKAGTVRIISIDNFPNFAGGLRLEIPPLFNLDVYRDWIAKQESGNSYGAVNPDSGALGKYQFMPDVMRALLGSDMTDRKFLASPELQEEAMHRYLLDGWARVSKLSDEPESQCRMLASYHYSGKPELYADTKPQTYNGKSYPSIAEYTASVCSKML